jgi:hypothetical protein
MSGILSRNLLTFNTDTLVYTVPAGQIASLTVSVCNQSPSSDARINMALTSNTIASMTANSYIEFNAIVSPFGVLERSAIVLEGGNTIRVLSTNSNTSVVVFGIEESAT